MNAPIRIDEYDLPARWRELRGQSPGLSERDFRARHPDLAEEVLGELLLRWQDARDEGRDEPPERLCADCPELADELRGRVEALRAMHAHFGMGAADGDATTEPGPTADPHATVGSTDADGTADQQPLDAAALNGWPSIPGYEILGELGHGGMGVVYKARQLKPSRVVAVKMLLSGRYAQPADRARFEGEAEALADLQHPNIVQIYQVGEVEGLPYFAMEYVEGGSLARHLQGKPLPLADAARLVETLARAVQAAHQRGIIHRDLKPANVLLSRRASSLACPPAEGKQGCLPYESEPKITDFGLAKRLGGEQGLTPSNAVMGTFRYMAPEQASGKPKDVGTPADVYALGGILYELLTGKPPVQAESDLEALRQLLQQQPPPPSRLNPAVDRNLETICQTCLHKDPARRYASAAALADDLRRYLAGEPIHARRAGTVERLVAWARRRPAVAALAGVSAVAALALVGVVVSLFYTGELKGARDNLAAANAQLGAAKERGEHFLYIDRMKFAHRAWHDGNVPLARALLDQQRADFRDFEWYYLKALSDRAGRELGKHKGGARAVAFSPDGKLLASAGEDGAVLVWDAVTMKRQHALTAPGASPAHALALGKGGRLASGHADGTVVLWDLARGGILRTLRGHNAAVYALAFSPDGARLVSTDEAGEARIWDVSGPTVPAPRVLANVPFCGVAFLPGGDQFLLTGGDFQSSRVAKKVPPKGAGLKVFGGKATSSGGEIRVYDAATGREDLPRRHDPRLIHGVAVSPDGKRFATAGYDHAVKIWEAGAEKPTFTLLGHGVEVLSVAFSPDGKRLASASWDRTVRLWDAETGQEVRVFRGHTDVVRAVAFGPAAAQRLRGSDGAITSGRLVSAGDDGTVRLWEADHDQTARVRRTDDADVRALAVGPDGGVLAWGGAKGQLWAWDLRGDRPRQIAFGSVPVAALTFSRDGKSLTTAHEDGEILVRDTDALDGPLAPIAPRLDPGPDRVALAMAFDPDGRRLAAVYGRRPRDGAPPLFDGGKVLKPFNGNKVKKTAAPVDVAERPEVVLWDVAGAKELRRFPWDAVGAVAAVAFSPDGRLLAAGGGQGEVTLWETSTGKEARRLRGHAGPVSALAFSPDGKTLASGGYDYTVRLWSLENGKAGHTLPGHVCLIHSLAFSPDGKRLASGSEDWTVKVWDVKLAVETLELRGHRDRVQAVAFAADGQRLFSGGGDGAVRVWEAPRR